MKTAKEMFEELGYELVFDEEDGKYYNRTNKWIEFTKGDFEFYIDIYCYNNEDEKKYGTYIDLNEFKAINKQVSELGWLDE